MTILGDYENSDDERDRQIELSNLDAIFSASGG